MDEMRLAICLAVKNEEDLILEWMAHHVLAGADTLIVLDDLSTDRTPEIVKNAAKHHDIRLSTYPTREKGKQGAVYSTICQQSRDEFDWIAFIDSDEFIVGFDGSMKQDLTRLKDASAIALNWLIFGSSGMAAPPDGPITKAYTHRAEVGFSANNHVKTIVRPTKVIESANPHHFQIDGPYVNADGEPAQWLKPGRIANPAKETSMRINHYFTRSLKDWEKRMARGQLGQTKRTMEDFHKYDRNEVDDATAAVGAEDLAAEMERLSR